MPWLVRMVGVVVTLGLVFVSLVMNFRFGQSLGRTEWDGMVYGLASVCADGFKVILPFAIMAAWTTQRRFAATVGAALWIIFTAYSMTSSIGHSAVNRAETRGEKQHHVSTYQDLRRSIDVKMLEREKLPSFRPLASVDAELKAARASGSFERTSGCTEWVPKNRSFCDGYNRLQSELGVAQRAVELDRDIERLRTSLNAASDNGKSGESDAQTAILKQLSGLAEDYVRLGLTLLVCVMVELGSGLGLYVVLGHGKWTPQLAPSPDVSTRANHVEWRQVRLIASPEDYASELDLYRDYCAWVVEHNCGPALSISAFRQWLVADAVGTPVRKQGKNYVTGVSIKERPKLTAAAA